MKPLLIFLFVIINTTFVAQASHTMGGEINYQYLGNNQYRVIVKLYRDCRQNALSDITIGYRAGSGGNSTSCGSGTLTGFVRTQIKEVTYICSTSKKPCYWQNTWMGGEGIELHIFEDTLDMSKAPFVNILSSNTCSELILFAQACCRSSAITTVMTADVFASTTLFLNNLSKCSKQVNSNPVFNRPWSLFLCCNQPFYASLGVRDTIDFDSISFELAPVIYSMAVDYANYTTPFTYKNPATPYCTNPGKINCTPNIQSSPPIGFYCNTRTGDIIFTPTKCNEGSVLVVEATEWRRDTSGIMVQISKTRRDNVLYVRDDCGYNNPPIITGDFEYKTAPGEKLCAPFKIVDKTFSPYQTTNDSIVVDWEGSAASPTWSTSGKTVLEFCWQVPKSAKVGTDYYFSIGALDQHCPKPAFSSRTFVVRVLEKDTYGVSAANGQPCSGFLAEATLKKGKSKDAQFNWILTDSATGIFVASAQSNIANFQYLRKGTYKLTLSIDHGIYFYNPYSTYFTVTTELPTVNIGNDTAICNGLTYKIQSKMVFMTSPIEYQWKLNNIPVSNQKSDSLYIQKLDPSNTISLFAIDSNGCIVKDTVTIKSELLPEVEWTQNPLESRCWLEGDFAINKAIKKPDSTQIKPGNFRIFGLLTQYGNLGLVDSADNDNFYFRQSWIDNAKDFIGGQYLKEDLTVWFKDSNGCENTAQTSIIINATPIIQLLDKSYCQNMGSTFLDSLILKPTDKNGTFQLWNVLETPVGVATSGLLKDVSGGRGLNWKFYFGNVNEDYYVGNYTLELKLTNTLSGCYQYDTAKIEIIGEPSLTSFPISSICSNKEMYDLMELFKVDGKTPDPVFSSFKINSRNGDTTKKAFGTAFINGHYLNGNAAGGSWSIQCTYSNKGCIASIPSVITLDYTPVAAFTTTPSSQAPVSDPKFNINNISSIESGEALNYQWYFEYPNFSKSSTGFAPQINYPPVDSTYTIWLEARTNKFCADTVTQKAIIGNGTASISGILIDNIRIDSRFVVSGITFQKAEMNVFNEVGQRIAQTTQNEGIDLPAGVYLYQAKINISPSESFIVSGKIAVSQK